MELELSVRDRYEILLAELVGQNVEALIEARRADNWNADGSLIGALQSVVEIATRSLAAFDRASSGLHHDLLLNLAAVVGRNEQFGVRP